MPPRHNECDPYSNHECFCMHPTVKAHREVHKRVSDTWVRYLGASTSCSKNVEVNKTVKEYG